MIPWPIALLSLFYGVLTAASAATVWKILTGALHQPLLWALAWLALSVGAMCGLALLKSWGRALAIFGSVLMAVLTLAVAGLCAINGHPFGGLLSTVGAGIHLIVIRYLRRPMVRAYFA